MPLWGGSDAAGNSTIFAVAQVNKAPNTANRTALFGNTTANGYGQSQVTGQYGVDATEMRAVRAAGEPRPAHPGWVLRTVGQGGRAGRVKYETLVAFGSMTGDAENTVFSQVGIQVTGNPAGAVGKVSNNDIVKFNSAAVGVPAGTPTYQWQKWGGAAFANIAAGGAYSNVTTVQLSVLANVEANGAIYRNGFYLAGANTKFSSNAVITIVP
jgi:hypothetical protein